MKGFGFLFLAALYGVSAQCAEVREGSVSMFVPGSYQSCSMAFVGNGEAEAGENTVPQASAPAQAFFPEGTRWTELRLDTREHQTWCDEEKRDEGSVLVPNYEQIEYYVQGDSTDEVLTYRYVWRHMEGKPDSIAFVICEDANKVMVTQPFYETLDGMEIFCFEFPAVVYDFAWRAGHNFWFQDMYESATTCFPTHTYSFGVLKEVSNATFGTSHTLEYVDVDSLITYTPQVDATVQRTASPLGMKAKLLKGIGITAWCGSSCLLAPACPDSTPMPSGASLPVLKGMERCSMTSGQMPRANW